MELKIECKDKLTYQMASLFHGALMELIPSEYADYLHLSQLHPYTQHLECRKDGWYWVITCMNRDAAKMIMQGALWNLSQIKIKRNDLDIDIVQRKYEEYTYERLTESFYQHDSNRYIALHFVSPTAFKQKGKYLFYPDLRCLFQSLMNKYDAATGHEEMFDEETLEQICESAAVVKYDLKSVNFSLEGVRIPAFIGKITIKMKGTQTLTNFVNMLVRFGEFSGVGIKTSLGMGCMKIIDERRMV